MKTNKHIRYDYGNFYHAGIPKGTPVIPADNLPQPNDSEIAYWAEPWKGMSERAQSWMRNYGFGIKKEDVEL